MGLKDVAEELGGQLNELRIWCGGTYYAVNEVRYNAETATIYGGFDPISKTTERITLVAGGECREDL